MRHPLWALNSILIILCAVAFIFVLLSREETPIWTPLKPSGPYQPIQQQASEINLSKIYEGDLFNTYEKRIGEEAHPRAVGNLPEPPRPKKVLIPEEPKPTFLPPLNISLKGVINAINDDSKNRAIIVDLKTKVEKVYKAGDFIEDAQLIKIFSKKIILLRANGQQEVLYLRAKDAEQDPAYTVIDGWEHVSQPLAENRFMISAQEFSNRVKSLAQFIDLLDITTAYQKGISIGCRIGEIKENSLGTYLGLRSGDIVTEINTISATDTAHRFAIYQEIIAMKEGSTITATVIRHGMPLTFAYILGDFISTGDELLGNASAERKIQERNTEQQRIRNMQERHKFAPTMNQIYEKERETVRHKGKSSSKNLTSLLAR
jgi:type II secretion system protein C